jgi:hypothetical protein
MNIFGAITILVAVFGAFLGGACCALLVARWSPAVAWFAVAFAALASGYLSLKVYYWCLRKLDESAKARKEKGESL